MSSTTDRAQVRLLSMNAAHHVRAVMGAEREKAVPFLAFGKRVYNGINGAPGMFSSLSALMPPLLVLLNTLDSAQQNVRLIYGGAAVRDGHLDALYTALDTLRVGVQALADASPEQATVIINTSGFKIADVVTHPKAVLQADAIGGGVVKLEANAGLLALENESGSRSLTFNWQSTLDGKTFTSAQSTPIGKTSIANLTPLTEVGFRVCITDSRGTGAWSQVVTVLVR
jgi:hypothetical protein